MKVAALAVFFVLWGSPAVGSSLTAKTLIETLEDHNVKVLDDLKAAQEALEAEEKTCKKKDMQFKQDIAEAEQKLEWRVDDKKKSTAAIAADEADIEDTEAEKEDTYFAGRHALDTSENLTKGYTEQIKDLSRTIEVVEKVREKIAKSDETKDDATAKTKAEKDAHQVTYKFKSNKILKMLDDLLSKFNAQKDETVQAKKDEKANHQVVSADLKQEMKHMKQKLENLKKSLEENKKDLETANDEIKKHNKEIADGKAAVEKNNNECLKAYETSNDKIASLTELDYVIKDVISFLQNDPKFTDNEKLHDVKPAVLLQISNSTRAAVHLLSMDAETEGLAKELKNDASRKGLKLVISRITEKILEVQAEITNLDTEFQECLNEVKMIGDEGNSLFDQFVEHKQLQTDWTKSQKEADENVGKATEALAQNEKDNEELRTQKNKDESDCEIALHELDHNTNLVNEAIKRFATNKERDGNAATEGHQTKMIEMLEKLKGEYTTSSAKRKKICTQQEQDKVVRFSDLAKEKAKQESKLAANSQSSKRLGEKLAELATSTENLEEDWTLLEERFARMNKQCAGTIEKGKLKNLAGNYAEPTKDDNEAVIKDVKKSFNERHDDKKKERQQDIANLKGAKKELTKALKIHKL